MPENDECQTLLDQVYSLQKSEGHTDRISRNPVLCFGPTPYGPWLVDEFPVGVIIQVTETARFHEQTVAMTEALMLGWVRQDELIEAASRIFLCENFIGGCSDGVCHNRTPLSDLF